MILLLLCVWVATELSLLLENKVFSDTKPDCNRVSSDAPLFLFLSFVYRM